MTGPSSVELLGWDRLRHGGLLLDPQRLRRVAGSTPDPLPAFEENELRRLATSFLGKSSSVPDFVSFVLEKVCDFTAGNGTWYRGSHIGAEWGRRSVTGETTKPRQLWLGPNGAVLPVFVDAESRLGIGRGRRAASQTVQWLRSGKERLALLTNGQQWRLIFAGLDFDAWCEWDLDLWFEEGALSPQVAALRTLLQPSLWAPPAVDAPPPLLTAILDSRKGQAELSTALGERVREAVELLVQSHGEALKESCVGVDSADIYRAAVRVVMRMVVVLFAESRELLPRDNALYHGAYGLTGLLEELEKTAARGGNRLSRSWNAWPRILALFRLVHQGSHHPQMPVPAYGGELFASSDPASVDGLTRALAAFETACFDPSRQVLPDRDVYGMLERLTRTRVKLHQGRARTWVMSPVDFSDLSSEYIGILYEGLLDFELKTAPAGDPVVFLAVGNQPALPLSRLELMDDKALTNLLEKMKDASIADDEEAQSEEPEIGDEGKSGEEETDDDEAVGGEVVADATDANSDSSDDRHTIRSRAEVWARRAVEAGKLARKPRGKLTSEKQLEFEHTIARKARQLVIRVILPGEWYLVRWGGTRKGSGTFYTRPGLAVPTVHRTLRPLAYTPPLSKDGSPDFEALSTTWAPKTPEEILALKVCDLACGSGTFPVASLRFLTEALYASLHHHSRVSVDGERAVVRLLASSAGQTGSDESLGQELLPARPDDPLFEPRLKAILRRHVVERSIYGVDLDPIAVELCRLALWIETMDRSLPFSFLDHKIKCGNGLVGAWFDQFQHYPVMAWKNREGGDKSHANGVHFKQEERTKAIKAFVKDRLTPDLRSFLGGRTLFSEDLQANAIAVHAKALKTLSHLHDLPVQDAAERARIYRDDLVGSAAYRSLKAAMDLWCSCWFWPADALEQAPLPTTLAAPPEETSATAELLAAKKRFFHWELEFPDVFRIAVSGFDAVLGNPPWENLQPNPEEFFSNFDPLYRTYGRLAKQARQGELFTADIALEQLWLDYAADFNNFSHWIGHSAEPFGSSDDDSPSGGSFSLGRGGKELHDRWRSQRRLSGGYANAEHPFRYQTGRIFTYKLFLEQCHALLRQGGRLGQVAPSGIYSDAWSKPLRELFLDHCRWEWLFGFENRDKVFEIDSRFKFNPLVVEKGGVTKAIRTAFMRRKLEDWENADALSTSYTRAQVEHFSPRSKAILEIQSKRDLEILEKIYTNSVLLGDDGPDSWGMKYKLEFMMNTDAHLFPPRPKWEADDYRPDEYSRWLKGDWRPIEELWADMGVDRLPAGESRCAQPPYDSLPIPRADIPAGIILSREADSWINEKGVDDVALPLYEGRMIGQYDFSQKGWVSGKGRAAVWRDIEWLGKRIEPQFLMSRSDFLNGTDEGRDFKVALMDITSSTNTRTVIATVLHGVPCGHKTPTLTPTPRSADRVLASAGILSSFLFDFEARARLGGNSLIWSVLAETAVPRGVMDHERELATTTAQLSIGSTCFASDWLRAQIVEERHPWRARWRLTDAARVEARAQFDALVFALSNLGLEEVLHILDGCDITAAETVVRLSKGFWRVDKNKEPELRHTVLTLVAFHDFEEKVRTCGGDRERGLEAFLSQNDGEGWMLPKTLRLADYGLGHDDRAKHPQPVASRLGPRFHDWQLAQSAEESWRECHLHARNLRGEAGYQQLLADIRAEGRGEEPSQVAEPAPKYQTRDSKRTLFDDK